MKTEKIDWKESTCPICGKKFIPAPEHVIAKAMAEQWGGDIRKE